MSFFDWFVPALKFRGVDVPSETAAKLETIEREFGPWWMLAERNAVANRDSLAEQFPGRDVLPFARRGDRDDVACVVTRDPHRPKGSVIIVHDGAMPGSELDAEFASLADWYAAASVPES
ncbi:MAG: hypothetical protein RQ966_00070 [Acetobacteraceae bacterium]|nr:hypothetical protein [Acetobacteraceae bacterium]